MQLSGMPSRPASAAKACQRTRAASMAMTLTTWQMMKDLEKAKEEGKENVEILPSGERAIAAQPES